MNPEEAEQTLNPEEAEQAMINEILSRDAEQEDAPTGIEGHKRQGAGSVSNAPAGEDKTASRYPLTEALSKIAEDEQEMRYPTFQEMSPTAKGVAGGMGVGGLTELAGQLALRSSNPRIHAVGEVIDDGTGFITPAFGGAGGAFGGLVESLQKVPVDKTASQSSLFNPLEKTAGPFSRVTNFTNNFLGRNVTKADNRLNEIKNVPSDTQQRYEYTQEASKDLKNAKIDRNRDRLKGGLALTGVGAGVGGYKAYQNSKEPVVDDTMNLQPEQKIAYDTIMSRLEKTASGPNAFEELLDRLEKTAAPNPAELLSAAKTKGGDALSAMKAGGADALVSARNLGQNALSGIQNVGASARDSLGSGYPNRVVGNEYRDVANGVPDTAQGDVLKNDALKQMLMAQGLTGAGLVGAGGAGYALANRGGDDDEEQVAYEELMDRLEKTAALPFDPRLGASMAAAQIGQNIGNAGRKAGDALAGLGQSARDSLGSGYLNRVVGNEYRDVANSVSDTAQGDILKRDALKQMLMAQGLTGAGAAGAGGLGYGAHAMATGGDNDEEQVAFENLMDRLEKTAAPGAGLFNKAKNALGDAKYKTKMGVRDFTGANERATGQNMQRLWDDPKNHNLSVADFQKQYDKLKGANESATARKGVARRNAAIGAAGATAGGAGVAGASALSKDDENGKSASNVLNGLYKEAASAIIDETLPPVRQHVDPMSKITFSR